MTKKKEPEEVCPDCKNPAHKPGLSEFSNCGESEISRSRHDESYFDEFEKTDYLSPRY